MIPMDLTFPCLKLERSQNHSILWTKTFKLLDMKGWYKI